MTTWLRCYWDEESLWFYVEVDADGYVTRQVELHEPDLTPLAAASLEEWEHAQQAGRLAQYEARYGLTGQRPIQEWEGHDPQRLSAGEFEDVWVAARRQLDRRSP